MAYPDGGIDTMLKESFVQVLPKFDDKKTREKFAGSLAIEQTETNKNLYYVVLTRAREQLIVPFWEGYSDSSMLNYMEPLLAATAVKRDGACYKERQLAPAEAKQLNSAHQKAEKTALLITPSEQLGKLQHTISPSLDKGEARTGIPATQSKTYSPALDLNPFKNVPSNEFGTWVHRLYQVYFTSPKLLAKFFSRNSKYLKENSDEHFSCISHLENFKAAVEQHLDNISSWKCEIPVTNVNHLNQVVNGVIDFIIVSSNCYLVVDHKTDFTIESDKYWLQLQQYKDAIGISDVDLAINWIRHGLVEIKRN